MATVNQVARFSTFDLDPTGDQTKTFESALEANSLPLDHRGPGRAVYTDHI